MGLIQAIINKENNKKTSTLSSKKTKRLISKIASVKNKILIPLAFIFSLPMKLLGFKYWDMYIVAKLKNN